MLRNLAAVTVLEPSYDDGLAFFRGVFGFAVLEDAFLSPAKRWVVVAPSAGPGAALALAVPSDVRQGAHVGDQTGGRVGFFLHPDDFWGDYENLPRRGINFLKEPRRELYGLAAAFVDRWGEKCDLPQPGGGAAEAL